VSVNQGKEIFKKVLRSFFNLAPAGFQLDTLVVQQVMLLINSEIFCDIKVNQVCKQEVQYCGGTDRVIVSH